VGAALVVVAVALLVIGMTESGDWGWLDGRTLAAAVAGAGAMALALVRSARSRAPAVDLDLLGKRTFLVANALSFVFAFAVFSWLLAAPLFAVNVWRYDALTAALSVAPCAVAATVTSLLAGRLPARGRAWAVVCGASLFAVTAGALAALLGDSPRFLSVWLPAGVLSGLALGAVLGSLSAAVADSVPPNRIAGGAGMNMTSRQLGGSLGVALLAALLGAGGAEAATDFTVIWLAGAAASLVAAAGGLGLLGFERTGGAPCVKRCLGLTWLGKP
jgi:MFS family permease